MNVHETVNIHATLTDLFGMVNIWLMGFTFVGLMLGLYRFNHLPLIGTYFRWKTFMSVSLVVYDLVVIYYNVQSLALSKEIRLTFLRFTLAWEIWYCFHYLFFRLNGTTRGRTTSK